MFPNGVVYEGVSDQAQFYRGESGANDSIIPTLDNFLEITSRMPSNPLTETLRDFRSYRPQQHIEFVNWVEQEAVKLSVRKYALQSPLSAGEYN
jgi:indoleamine 2,3-dioxygenase